MTTSSRSVADCAVNSNFENADQQQGPRVKLREKPSSVNYHHQDGGYVKNFTTAKSALYRQQQCRPFSCDIENLSKFHAAMNDTSNYFHLNGSASTLNGEESNNGADGRRPPRAPPSAAFNGSCQMLNRTGAGNEFNRFPLEIYDKSPIFPPFGRLYEQRRPTAVVSDRTPNCQQQQQQVSSHWQQSPVARKMHQQQQHNYANLISPPPPPQCQPYNNRNYGGNLLKVADDNRCYVDGVEPKKELLAGSNVNKLDYSNNGLLGKASSAKLKPKLVEGTAAGGGGGGGRNNEDTSTSTLNGLLPRRAEYGSASSIDRAALASRSSSSNVNKQRFTEDGVVDRDNRLPHSSSSTDKRLNVLYGQHVTSSTSSVPKLLISARSADESSTSRASLRREKAFDLTSFSATFDNGLLDVAPSALSNGKRKDKEKDKAPKSASGKKSSENKAKTGRSKSGNESILKKLIGVGHKTHSTDIPDHSYVGNSMSTPLGHRDFVKPTDFGSDSLDFRCEEKLRKKIFAHYDCGSIGAETAHLLNGASRLKEEHLALNATTGASQASRSKLWTSPADNTTLTSPVSENQDPNATSANNVDAAPTDTGDGKSNILVSSCSYFRNELGNEPVKVVALNRDHICSNINGDSTDNGHLTLEEKETRLRCPTAAEASVLENLSNVYMGGRLCAKRQDNLVIEHVDQGAFFYRHCFSGKAHQNYFGIDEHLGPVAVSVIRDKMEMLEFRKSGLTSPNLYRIIIRLSDLNTFRGSILQDALPSHQHNTSKDQQAGVVQNPGSGPGSTTNGKYPVKELLELTVPDVQLSCLRLAVPVPRTEEMLLKLDEQGIYTRFKVGILYCRSSQCTEEEMYNNEKAGPAFEEFLDMIGQRIRLKGFDKYKGGLDNKGDTTGQYSLYTTHQQYEVMFHVSTMLPFTPSNKQQLSRKRHIGNDIVTLVFQEPDALPFSPQHVRSHFQHVFIVVRAHSPNTDNVRYSVAVSRCKDVLPFGPAIPSTAAFPKSKDFRDFLLTKIINAENAVHKSDKFAAMAARTRREFIRDLAENHVTSHTLESSSGKIGKILGSSSKRKDRPKPKVFLDSFVRGAIAWDVQVLAMVEDFALCKSVECFLGISVDYFVLIEKSPNREVLFCTPTHSVIGWTSHGNSLKLYYDHAEVVILRTVDDDDCSEMQEVIKRLQAVSKGCETVEMILRRNASGQLGFNIQQEGIVSEVEMYNSAWQAGLRQGSRLVEICKVSVATLTYDRMLELLRTSMNIRVMVINALEDGSPRRGCEDPYCPAVLTDDSAFPVYSNEKISNNVSSVSSRQPPSYETAILRKHLVINSSSNLTNELEALSPEGRNDNGYESGGNIFSKSLDDFQANKTDRNSDELRSNSADHGFYGSVGQPEYPSNTLSSMSSEEHWQCANGQAKPPARTDTLSSTGSTASSEMSSDSMTGIGVKKRTTRPVELKRKVDKSNSDAILRKIRESGDSSPVSHVPPLPPKTYKAKVPLSQPSLSSGQLTVPSFNIVSRQKSSEGSSSVQENLMRLIGNVSSSSSEILPTDHLMSKEISARHDSPEMNNYQMKYQAALQRIKVLEEKVERLQLDLNKNQERALISDFFIIIVHPTKACRLVLYLFYLQERESKRRLDFDVISLKDSNKRLAEECRQAQLELKRFTDWFLEAIENGSSLQSKIPNENE